MKRLLTVAAVLVAISSSSFALDAVQAKRIKKAVASASLPEVPGVVAALVTQAAKADQSEVALTAVQAAVYKAPSSTPMVVAAIAKAAPELTEVVQKKVIELQPTGVASPAADRGGRAGIVITSGEGNGNGRGGGNSGEGGGNSVNFGPRGGSNGNAFGRFDPSEHNPGPPLPGSGPHHNRPDHPLGGPPGLIDYSKPRPHH